MKTCIAVFLLLGSIACASEKRSTTFAGTSDQAFNAALLAAREYSQVHYASVPAGVILFTRSAWDCGLKISGSDGAVKIELRVSGIKKEPASKDADSLAKEIFGLVEKKRGAAMDQIVKSHGSIEERLAASELQLHNTSADNVYAVMKKIAERCGTVESQDSAARTLTIIGPPEYGISLVLLPKLIDQEDGNVKAVVKFRSSNGASPNSDPNEAIEMFLSQLKAGMEADSGKRN